MKKFLKLGLSGLGVVSTGAVAVVTTIEVGQKSEPTAKSDILVELDDKVFTNRSELTQYIRKEADEQSFKTGDKAFSLKVGQNSMVFSHAQEASQYVEDYFTTNFKAYLKPNYEDYVDPLTGIISSEGYYEDSDVFFNTYKTNNGSYTFAPKDDFEANEKAKREAAETYLTLHNAYYWNDIYFNNKVSLERYLKTTTDDVADLSTSPQPMLINESGNARQLDVSTNEKYKSFMGWLSRTSHPTIEVDGERVPLESNRIPEIVGRIDEDSFSYLPIIANGDKVTKIVDISQNTESGNLYGPYMIESGSSLTDIKDNSLWVETSDKVKGFTNTSEELEIISNVINIVFAKYVDPASGMGVLESLVNEFSFNGRKLFEIISPIEIVTTKFIKDVSNGQRGTLFNSLHALYSFVINQLIHNKQPSAMIKEFNSYMDSVTKLMDAHLAKSLIPFLYSFDFENYDFSFFNAIYSFGKKGFQNNIDSYWRQIEDDEEYGLSSIKDLILISSDISALVAPAVRDVDDKIAKHIKMLKSQEKIINDENALIQNGGSNPGALEYAKNNTIEKYADRAISNLINSFDEDYLNAIEDVSRIVLKTDSSIGNLSVEDIYSNINFATNSIYKQSLIKYYDSVIASVKGDTMLWKYRNNESTKNLYQGLKIVGDEEWIETFETKLNEADPNVSKITKISRSKFTGFWVGKRHKESDDTKGSAGMQYSNLLGSFQGAVNFLTDTSHYSPDAWAGINVEVITDVVFAAADIVFGVLMFSLGAATMGASVAVYAAVKMVTSIIVSLLPEKAAFGERAKTYNYYDSGNDKDWYWDGGLESWTWFGIGGKKEESGLKDLEMIVTDNIIDGYFENEFYFDGVTYDDVTAAKSAELYYLSQNLQQDVFVNSNWSNENELIIWESRFNDGFNITGTCLDDILTKLQEPDVVKNATRDFYNINGELVDDQNKILDDQIEKWLSSVKPIIIVQSPTLLPNGDYHKNEFDLPKPRYTDSGFELEGESNIEYEVINSNINVEVLDEKLASNTYSDSFVDSVKTLTVMTETELIENALRVNSSHIHPKTKLVLFDVMNDQGEQMIFEDLSTSYESSNLTKVKFKDGSIHVFLSKTSAVDNSLSEENYDFKILDVGRTFIQYAFKGYIESGIDDIVDNIINESKGGSYAQQLHY